MFPITSRYYGIETTTLEADEDEGRSVAYLRRRFIPPPEQFALLQEHTVTRGDRLDNLADQYIGDPELFWRICDANNAMRPEDLTAPDRIGSKLRITLPQGIPGMEMPNA
ncbi:MAG TPA: LysM domain-containing protein [Chloroflexia bacterium]|jgi:nucleoid-associated protein YgaU